MSDQLKGVLENIRTEYDSGIAVPGYLAREVGQAYRTFVPQGSMICNFT